MHSATIDPGILRAVSRSLSASEGASFRALTIRADKLRCAVERDWSGMPEAQRRALYGLALRLEVGSQSTFSDWLHSFAARIFPVTRDPDFTAFVESLYTLSDAVIDAVERSHPDFGAAMQGALKDVIRSRSEAMTSDDFRKWLAGKLQDPSRAELRGQSR